MARALTALIGLVVLAPWSAFGGGQYLSWDDCVPSPSNVKTFACDRNTGFDVLVGSFEPYEVMPDMIGIEAAVDLYFRDGFVPSWWQSQNGGCRTGALAVNGIFSDQQTACVDPWQSQVSGGVVVVEPAFQGNPARLRITLSMGVPYAAAFSVAPGTVYYGYQLQIRRGSTIGPGACSGCDEPAIVLPAYTKLLSASSGYQPITSPLFGTYGCWQCDCGIGEWDFYFGVCSVTPVLDHTWGRVKSLYR